MTSAQTGRARRSAAALAITLVALGVAAALLGPRVWRIQHWRRVAASITACDDAELAPLFEELRLAECPDESVATLDEALAARYARGLPQISDEKAELFRNAVARLGLHDPDALVPLLGTSLDPLAYHGLLELHRFDLLPQTPREVTLLSRCKHHDYERACASFEWGGRVSTELTRNDWDLLYGNGEPPDDFTVNTVVNDRSAIADIGACALAAVSVPALDDPRWVTDEDRATRGRYDVPVVLGDTYVVHTVDDDTDLLAAFTVVEHQSGDHVKLAFRLLESPRQVAKGVLRNLPR